MRKTLFKAHVSRDTVAKLFFDATDERYPGADKMLQLVSSIVDPLSQVPLENTQIKIVLLNAIRDMIREVSPTHLFRSLQHRDDLFNAVIEALERLENRFEELQEQENPPETEEEGVP